MVVRTILVLLYVAGFAVMGFFAGRLPKPTPALLLPRAGFAVLAVGLSLSHAPWSFRVAATCATFVAVGVAWYFGARERKRDGFAPFAHPPLPEGHKPTFGERARRLFTPMRWMFGLVVVFNWLVLFVGDVGTRGERRAESLPSEAR
jgi:hypothetical protein